MLIIISNIIHDILLNIKYIYNIYIWLVNNNLLINSSKTMLLNISLSNFVFPDIIFDYLLITPSSKIKFPGIFVSCIYRSQIMYHIYM